MAWLTGDIPPDGDFICRRLRIPNEQTLRASVAGALLSLTKCDNWEKFGALEPEAASKLMMTMIREFLEDDMCEIGEIKMFARDSLPANILPCDGSTHTAADYPLLWDVLPPGLKDGITNTFTTPDLRDRFILSSGTNAVGDTGGNKDHVLTVDELPPHSHTNAPHTHTADPHTHTFTSPTFGIDIESVGVPDPTGVGNPPLTLTTSAAVVGIGSNSIQIDDTGGGQAHNNMPPYYVAIFGIVAR